jgi:dTDP-glucose 4,6-dehydratase
MNSVLVTGGAGFIGSNFVRRLLQHDSGVRIVNLDALTYAGSLENLSGLPDPGRHRFVQGDICDRDLTESLLREYQVDTVAHFDAETHVDRSISGPSPFIQTNVFGTFNLLEACRRAWLEDRVVDLGSTLFLHVSTDEVFGSLSETEPAFRESTPYAPNSPYAASKAASDHLVRAYTHTYGLPAIVTSCSNNYGPNQFPEKLIPLTVLNALAGKPIPVYGDGSNIRDWLYVADHCEALELVLRRGIVAETYNIGGGNQPTNLELIQMVCDILDEARPNSPWVPHRSLIQFVADRPGHDRRYAMDSGKIRHELGWQPRRTLAEGLHETVEWYLSNPGWVAAIREAPEYRAWLAAHYAGPDGAGDG